MLGVYDFFKIANIDAFQIIPDLKYYTLDIPNMSKEFKPFQEPVCQWLIRNSDVKTLESSTVVINMCVMFNEEITEVVRVENDEWEVFAGAGTDVKFEDIRVVSLGTIIGIDKTMLKRK